MQRWKDRVAVVTGASSGIGAAISLELVKHGLQVAGIARRVDKVQVGYPCSLLCILNSPHSPFTAFLTKEPI
jgi:NAD(P)-dependent dehydrogenase (short-subunit alcohol dehydrogenase family)